MRSRIWLALLICMLVTLVAAPAGARKVEQVGDLIKLFFDDDSATHGNQWTVTADAPFHIVHGHGFLGHKRKNYQLPMAVDGTLWEPDAIRIVPPNRDFWGVANTMGLKPLRGLWNFPDGLPAGEYTLIGTWSYPCAVAVASGFYTGECENPNDMWEQGSLTLELTVVESSG